MSDKEKEVEIDKDVLTDEEITTISAGVNNVFEDKNANNGEGLTHG